MRFIPAGSDEEKAALARAQSMACQEQLQQPRDTEADNGVGDPCMAIATVAGGCFWGVEDALRSLPGVCEAVSGYTGGHTVTPSYKDVCRGDTGHAEAVRLRFDPARITYRQILQRFFEIHDPTQLNRQGPDVGTQYRSAIFYADAEQKAVAEELLVQLRRLGYKPVTQLEPAGPFYAAEAYHQNFAARTGRGACHMSVPRFSQRVDGAPGAE